MKPSIFAVMLATGLLQGAEASAETRSLRPGIIGADNRETADSAERPWRAIGHINVSGYSSLSKCTGTQIARRVILTSAHCVINFARKTVAPAKDIHFVAGVNKETSVGHSTARCVLLPDDLAIGAATRVLPDIRTTRLSPAFLKRDLALVILNDDIAKAGVIPPLQSGLRAGAQVDHAGYPADRRMVLNIHRNCSVLGAYGDLVATDCDTVAGSSGGPLLVKQAGEWRVAAVMGATTGKDVNLAVPLSVWPTMPLDGICP
jgi:protease YdgD